MSSDTPHLVIYHGNCCDGFTAAWAANRLLDGPCELFAATYAADGEDVELPDVTGRRVYMVDFCVGAEQLHALVEAADEIHVFDHHSENEKACGHIDCCTFDMNRSGAGLTWDILSGGGARFWLINYVEDRDLWRHALPDTKAINAYIALVPKTIDAWDLLLEEGSVNVAALGEVALAARAAYVESMLPLARAMTFLGHENIPVVNAPRPHISDLLGRLAEGSVCEECKGRGEVTLYEQGEGGYPEGSALCPDCEGRGKRQPAFAVGWHQRSDGRYVYDLRSRGDFDVGALAQTMGGGGHPQAAGFTTSTSVERDRLLDEARLEAVEIATIARDGDYGEENFRRVAAEYGWSYLYDDSAASCQLARRAYAAVARLGLDPQDLLKAAKVFGELSPAWDASLRALVVEAWGDCVWDRQEWFGDSRLVQWTAHRYGEDPGLREFVGSFAGDNDALALTYALEARP